MMMEMLVLSYWSVYDIENVIIQKCENSEDF